MNLLIKIFLSLLTGFTPTVHFLMVNLYHSHHSHADYCFACTCPINHFFFVSSSMDLVVRLSLLETYHTGYLITHTNTCTFIYSLRSLKFTLKHLKRSYMFQSHDCPQGAYIVPCQSYNLKHSVNYIIMLTWCCGSMSCFVCES